MQTVVRLHGEVEQMLLDMVEKGYYQNKTEAIRAGILEIAHKWGFGKQIEDDLVIARMKEMEAEVKVGKRKMVPLDNVLKKAGIKRESLD
jgi:Arc/MetJ-type ribon-helix-helix transcriptional regulator